MNQVSRPEFKLTKPIQDPISKETTVEVHYFQRRPRAKANFSMEAIFEDVRSRLRDRIKAHVHFSSKFNDGYVSKAWNIVEASHRRSDGVNHITGEVHFLNLLMPTDTVLLTILDCGFMQRKRGLGRWLIKKLYLDWPIQKARFVTAISEQTRLEIIEYTNCDPAKILIIPVAINENFRPAPKPFNEECPRVLQIGTGYNKNIPRLAEALKGLHCKLMIIGELSSAQRGLLLEKQIDFESGVGLTQEQMVAEYEACDIVSFVSTFEGFGMPIVEANAVERVVITSNISSMPEVAGDAACFVDPTDVSSIKAGFEKVITDGSYRETLIANGRKNRKRFDPQRIADQYLELYKQIASSSAGLGPAID